MKLNQLYRVTTTVMVALVCVMFMTTCQDDSLANHIQEYETQDGHISFSVTVPGYALPTRAETNNIDTLISTLHLYLFDNKEYFIGIVEATPATPGSGYNDEHLTTEGDLNTEVSYSANIPQNAEKVHLVANYPKPGNEWLQEYKGRLLDEVIPNMTTSQQVYWGQSTFADLKMSDDPVILYRNYAKVEYGTELIEGSYILDILGWTLCNIPQNGTVAPFDIEAIDSEPFHFSLTSGDESDRFSTIPFSSYRKELVSPVSLTDSEENIASLLQTNATKPMPMFDHKADEYGEEAYAIFLIESYADETKTESVELYYKIAFQNSDEVLDIKRNHKYVITFKDINPEFGKTSYALAYAGEPANNAYIMVNEVLPSLEGDSKTLEVANGTLRYIDDLTTGSYTQVSGVTPETYTVDDIYINYTGNPANLKVSWKETDFGTSYVPETESGSLTIESVGNQTTADGKAYTHKVSFEADAFNFGDNDENHYKEGLICIAEKTGTLSRFVRVYIGDPISFRPLLYSSDIPNLANERISVVFNVPGEEYLPATLYPIEIRFGSDRVDVEKNLQTESMKVEQPATDDYTGVLEWKSPDNTTYYDWTATGTEENKWGYKYVYTIHSQEEKGQHFVTLRTVDDQSTDFNVMMEGISTVIRDGAGEEKADIFNTRRLPFKMQSAGTDSRRIMLDNGLHETRLVTAYVNALNTSSEISIAYTLGTYNEGVMNSASGTINTTLWVYYDPDKLTPSGSWYVENADGTPATKTDPEGNYYVSATATSATGTLTFTPVSGATIENTMIFITARSNASAYTDNPYGTYDANASNNTEKYIYTGVNADDDAYRSASVMVSVVDKYVFNQALAVSESESASIALDAYTRTNELELNYGKENEHIYLRIDKPVNTERAVIKITSPTLLLHTEDNNEYLDGFTVLSKDDTNGVYYIELDNDAAAFAYLHFHSNQYVSAGTLTLESVDAAVTVNSTNIPASTVPYDKATVKLTNVPITIPGFAFAREQLLKNNPGTFSTGGSNTVASDTPQKDYNLNDYVNKTVIPVKGAHVGIRVFFPGDFIEKLNEEDTNNTKTFTFRLTTGEYELFYKDCIETDGANCLPADANKYDEKYKYKGLNKGNNTILVQTKVSDLTVSTDSRFEGAYYLDLFLRNRTCNPYTEKVYFRSNNEVDEDGNDVEPIKFNTTIASMDRNYRFGDGGYVDPQISYEIGAVLVERSIDNATFDDANEPLYNVNANSTVYYKVKLPNVGKYNRGDKSFTITVDAGGKLTNTTTVADNIKSITQDADGKQVFTMEVSEPKAGDDGTYPQYNTDSEVTLSFTPTDDVKFDEGDSIVVKIDTGETVKSEDYTSVLRGAHELAFDWTATTLDGSALLENGTYSGSAQGKDVISVSDFAEQLTLTFKNITEDITLSLPEGSLYKFKEGSATITSTSPTVTLVPVSPNSSPEGLSGKAFSSTAELVDGQLKINGTTSSGNTYLANAEVKIRPYLNATTEGMKSLMGTGDEMTLTLTMDDQQHVDKQIDFRPQMGYNDEERTPYSRGGEYFMVTKESSHDYSNRVIYSNGAVTEGFTYTVTWEVAKVGGGPVLQITPEDETDILSGDKFFTPRKVNLFYPKMSTVGSAKIIFSLEEAGADTKSVAPAEIPFAEGAEITIPQNFTVYKEGYTLTGWTDGTTIYSLGSTVKLYKETTLTPVFTQNPVSLSDRAEDITIRWDFQQQNGAPVTGWQGPTHVWVAQATINGEIIDVPMTINTSAGKFNNESWGDWAQINGGTILTIPSYEGATVRLSGYYTTTSTTIAGKAVTSNSDKIHTYTHSGTEETVDINIDGSYWKYVEVTLPVEKGINIIPTTTDRPFNLKETTLLYDSSKGQASAGGSNEPVYSTDHLDWMANGDYAEYKVTNTENTAYRISFNTATPLEGVTLTFTLYDEAGSQVWSGTSLALTQNSSGDDWSTKNTGQILTNYLQKGSYKLRITFNKDGSSTTANLYSVSFTPIEYKIGLGTWASTVVYENITVKNLDDGSTIYSSGSNVSSSDWNTSTGLYQSGDNATYGSQLGLSDGGNGTTAVLNKEIATNNYELTCRAMKTSGSEGFLIMFDYADDNNRKWWNIGGWSNTVQTVETWVNDNREMNYNANNKAFVNEGIWYNIKVTVQNGTVTCSCEPAELGGTYKMEYTFNNVTNTPISATATPIPSSTRVELSPQTASEENTSTSTTWKFKDTDVTITSAGDKTWGTTSASTRDFMKMSRNHDFYINIPSGKVATRVEVWGASLSGDGDYSYIKTFGSFTEGDNIVHESDLKAEGNSNIQQYADYPMQAFKTNNQAPETTPIAIFENSTWSGTQTLGFGGYSQVGAIVVLYLINEADLQYYSKDKDMTLSNGTPALNEKQQ